MVLTKFHPFIRTPLTDLGAHMFTHQSGTTCCDFEMRMVECVEAYGIGQAEAKCKDYFDDLAECMLSTKAWNRHKAMERERKRQVAAGELNKEDRYPVQSRVDGY
ncbi:hypothetical protein HAZT_HAZT002529 [Hyalella azteca]|uniref:NADH dehydrogenase [ubiquinone] iron-sulfur protein 5 n=1 Tax=Hyalella azteca TaxID=294128 RepID=A0A6A0H2L5_HYAAZ|nr:NADH dehydrogenase [ubiquinone] iron-sulfur protein 5 [Hyalella azteca]KAA0197276.1 hypothetical protein HAZT_HAZT002529 [Hyalella azteca]